MNREKQLRLGSFLLSITVHAALFIQVASMSVGSEAQAPKLATRISLNLLSPQKPQQPLHAEIRPVQPEQRAKKQVIQEEKIIRIEQEQAIAPKVAEEIRREQVTDRVPARQRYLARLLTHIEGYKYYPPLARRRGVRGSIQVSFRLQANGDISGLLANGGPLILRQAAKNAVNRALPMPACPAEVTCPIQVSYAMQFQLR